MNFERLLDQVFEVGIEKVVITHKDTFCRIVYDLVEFLHNKFIDKIKTVIPIEGSETERDTLQRQL
jgi:predicted site-specific integrase-resolvase